MSGARLQSGPVASNCHPSPSRCATAWPGQTTTNTRRPKTETAGVESRYPHTLRGGIGVPINRRSSRATLNGRGFSMLNTSMAARMPSLNGGACRSTREGAPVPVAGTPILHVLPPFIGVKCGGFLTRSTGAIHG